MDQPAPITYSIVQVSRGKNPKYVVAGPDPHNRSNIKYYGKATTKAAAEKHAHSLRASEGKRRLEALRREEERLARRSRLTPGELAEIEALESEIRHGYAEEPEYPMYRIHPEAVRRGRRAAEREELARLGSELGIRFTPGSSLASTAITALSTPTVASSRAPSPPPPPRPPPPPPTSSSSAPTPGAIAAAAAAAASASSARRQAAIETREAERAAKGVQFGKVVPTSFSPEELEEFAKKEYLGEGRRIRRIPGHRGGHPKCAICEGIRALEGTPWAYKK